MTERPGAASIVNSAVGYIVLKDMLAGLQQEIQDAAILQPSASGVTDAQPGYASVPIRLRTSGADTSYIGGLTLPYS